MGDARGLLEEVEIKETFCGRSTFLRSWQALKAQSSSHQTVTANEMTIRYRAEADVHLIFQAANVGSRVSANQISLGPPKTTNTLAI